MASETTFLSTDPYLDVEDAAKGVRAVFEKGRFTTDDGDVIEFLKGLPYFGVSLYQDDSGVDDHIRETISANVGSPKIIPDSVTTEGRNFKGPQGKGRVPESVVTEIPPDSNPGPETDPASENPQVHYAEGTPQPGKQRPENPPAGAKKARTPDKDKSEK